MVHVHLRNLIPVRKQLAIRHSTSNGATTIPTTPRVRPFQIVSLFALIFALVPFADHTRPAFAPKPPPAPTPNASAAPTTLLCDTSPFGSFIVAGAEREIMLSYRTGNATPLVRYERIDRDGVNLRRDVTTDGAASPRAVVGAPIDAGADGIMDFAQVYVDAAGVFQRVLYRTGSLEGPTNHTASMNATLIASAAAPASYRSAALSYAFRSSVGSLRVELTSAQSTSQSSAYCFDQRNARLNVQAIALAVGDLQRSGFARERVVSYIDNNGAARLLVLTSDSTGPVSGTGFAYNGLKELTDLTLNIGTPQSIQVAVADVDGDFQPEVIVAQEQYDNQSTPVSVGVAVRIYKPTITGTTFTLEPWASFNSGDATTSLKLAAADTDRDGKAEVVLAYQRFDSIAGLVVASYDLQSNQDGTGTFIAHNRYFNLQTPVIPLELALTADDMDRDGLADVVFATANGTQMLVQRLGDSLAPGAGFTPRGTLTSTETGRRGATQLVLGMGDADNDSLIARYTPTSTIPLCKDVTEP